MTSPQSAAEQPTAPAVPRPSDLAGDDTALLAEVRAELEQLDELAQKAESADSEDEFVSLTAAACDLVDTVSSRLTEELDAATRRH